MILESPDLSYDNKRVLALVIDDQLDIITKMVLLGDDGKVQTLKSTGGNQLDGVFGDLYLYDDD